jgi:phosphate transport system permease protein
VALLLIPFLAPLMADAIRNVATAGREASFGLGANRLYTLRRIVLPQAAPGILSAVVLGLLKALGDTLIVVFVVGWEANAIPKPAFDLLERTPSLAAVGAGLLGSFETVGASCSPTQCAVGYSAALFLLIIAGLIVVSLTILQNRWRARVRA